MNVKEIIIRQLNLTPAAPFLFIGSGMSRRYLGLENWSDLLEKFSTDAPKPYRYYFSSADGSLPKLATFLAEDFHEIWWRDDKFALSRLEHKATTKSSALKIEIARYLKQKMLNYSVDEQLANELSLFKNVNIDGIITTNWDYFLENMFSDFEVYIGQQLLFEKTHSVGEIYKIHGCISEPDSLVLTHEDYKIYNDKNPYLAAKLLTVFIENPIIFLGYSMTDKNVLKILASIASCLNNETVEQLKDRLIFVDYNEDRDEPVVLSKNIIITEGRSLPITVVEAKDFSIIYEALAAIPRKLPAQLLRRLKSQVSDLVLNQDPENKLQVIHIEDDTKASDIEVVFGVGVLNQIGSTGYKALQASDLLNDLINRDCQFDARNILTDALPDLLKSSPNIPIFKYLAEAGRINEKQIDTNCLDARVVKASQRSYESFRVKQNLKQAPKIQKDFSGVKDLVDSQDGHLRCLWQIPMLRSSQINLIELRNVLLSFQHLLSYGELRQIPTDYRKLICLYDYLQYHPSQNS